MRCPIVIFLEDTLGTLFIKQKQAILIMSLSDRSKEWHISNLAAVSGVTYVHTSKFISKCEELGIVASEKHGRTKMLVLTDKGEQIAKNISSIMDKTGIRTQSGQA